MYRVVVDMVCCPGFTMAFWEKGVQAEMFCKKAENGGPVWKRAEFVCQVLLLLSTPFTAAVGPLFVHECPGRI